MTTWTEETDPSTSWLNINNAGIGYNLWNDEALWDGAALWNETGQWTAIDTGDPTDAI